MSAIPNPFPLFTTDGKPFVATNRYGTGRYSEQFYNDQIADPVLKSLDGTPAKRRGSRTRPSVMRYPYDLGNAQVPHAMQFKIFWRWENKDVVQSLKSQKAESVKMIGNLNTLSSLVEGGNLTPDMLLKSPLSNEQVSAYSDIIDDPNYLKVVDPNANDNMATLLQNNPGKAKSVLEETVRSEQMRITSIENELSNGAGRVGLDENERLQIQDRTSTSISNLDIGQAALVGGGVGLLAGGAVGAPVPGAAITGTVVAGTVGVAKAETREPVYDQMGSIYLPFCTKVNNEDSFLYEDPSQAIIGGVVDFLGRPVDTAAQGLQALVQGSLDKILPGSVGVGTGKVINPRLEKLFKQKDFRNFSFSWEFYPRTQQEVQEIKDIIETFRYHSHPARMEEVAGDAESDVLVVLRVPAEFEIRFLSTNPDRGQAGFVENEYLPKIARCALVSVAVDYTPNSVFSTFVDNSPTAITLTLNFSEMGILTRDAVERGF
jgi:hypothetical protein